MASPVSDMWTHATVRIENEWGETGSGFFVSRKLDNNRTKHFVVTNKHVINDDPALRRDTSVVYLHINVNRDGELVGQTFALPFRYANSGAPAWREHPEQEVDVLAFDVTGLISESKDLEYRLVSYEVFADANWIKEERITAGDDVVVVGYPKGIRQGKANYPLFRQGMLATRLDEELHEEIVNSGGVTVGMRTLRGFLIDGAMIPGSSGSPVILKPVVRVSGTEQVETIERTATLLLGIIAETRYVPRRTPTGHVSSFAGLALAFNADTIRETVELFF